MKKIFAILLTLLIFQISPCFAFEDGLITGDKKLSDIKIEDNSIIDVFPLYTVMNEKNTLIVHPLKEGNTRFSVLKGGKNIVVFNVNVTEDETKIDDVSGFEVLTIDCPPNFYEYLLDEPPMIGE